MRGDLYERAVLLEEVREAVNDIKSGKAQKYGENEKESKYS